jgi:hypothetical protein
MLHTIAFALALGLLPRIDVPVEGFHLEDDIQGAEALTTRVDRLAAFLCALQPRLRWHRGREWTAPVCREAAQAFVNETDAAGLHDLLAVAVAVQESDLVDTALSPDGRDSGLMGVRDRSKWTRGVKPADLRKIPVNIRVGVAELRDVHDGEYRQTYVTEYLLKDGRRVIRAVSRPCNHEGRNGHPWVTHYNNGPRVHRDAYKAAYGARVAAIYQALCQRLGDTPTADMQEWSAPSDHRTRALVKVIDDLEWSNPQNAELVD